MGPKSSTDRRWNFDVGLFRDGNMVEKEALWCGVQIYADGGAMLKKIKKRNTEIRCLEEVIKTTPKGVAYTIERQLKEMLRKELIAESGKYLNSLYVFVAKHVNDIKCEDIAEASEKMGEGQMILNVSCLVDKKKVKKLSKVVDKIDRARYFSVRLTEGVNG